MTNIEKVKKVRQLTLSPLGKVSDALRRSNWDVDAAVEMLVKEKQADANEMANRTANTCIVHSYVHNNRVGAMIVLACQTDFVAKNAAFLNLAKNICMHIVSTPVAPKYVDKSDMPDNLYQAIELDYKLNCGNKPAAIVEKIVAGKMQKWMAENCLLFQPFVREETVTIGQLINDVSSTLGEKVEVKRFIKMTAQ